MTTAVQPCVQQCWKQTDNTLKPFKDYWGSLFKPTIKITKSSLKITKAYMTATTVRVAGAIKGLGLFEGFSIISYLYSFIKSIVSGVQNLKKEDIEGFFLNLVSMVREPLNILKAAIAFATAICFFAAIPISAAFATLATALTFITLAIAIGKNAYSLHMQRMMKRELKQAGFSEKPETVDRQQLRNWLDRYINQARLASNNIDAKPQTANECKLQRRTHVVVFRNLVRLRIALKSDETTDADIKQTLRNTTLLVKRQYRSDSITLSVKTIAFVALAVLALTSLIFLIPTLALIATETTTIGNWLHDKFALQKGIEWPNLVAPAT